VSRHRAEADARHEGQPYRWVIFGAMCGVYFAFGVILLAIPPMVADVRADLDISRGMLGFALGAWSLIYIVTCPPAGRIIDRLGLRRSLTAGSLLVAASAALQSLAQGVAMLWLAIAIIGIGGPLVSLSAPKLVAEWFDSSHERSLAVGFYTSAPAIGGVFALALTNSVLLPAFGDWRGVLMFEAAMCAVAAVAWVLVSGRAPTRSVNEPVDSASSGSTQMARALLADRGVRLAMLLGVATFFVSQGMGAWLPNMLEEGAGLSTRAASNWAAVSLAVGIVARLVMPGLALPGQRTRILTALMITLAVAMMLMAFGPPATDLVAALVLGLRSALSSLVILVLMDAEPVTAANIGLAYGFLFSAGQVGGALGPQVVGMFGDSELGFPGALVGMTILLLAMVAVLVRDDRRLRRHTELDLLPVAMTGPTPQPDEEHT
jgi:cyanate permease